MNAIIAAIMAFITSLGITLPAGSSIPGVPAPHPAATTISAFEAENIALRHAGLNRNQVRFDDRTELDWENGQRVWEVSFDHGNWDYDYDINASNGRIVSWDKDWD